MKLIFSMVFLFNFFQFAWAGGSSSGGAKGISCLEDGVLKEYLADTFWEVHSGKLDSILAVNSGTLMRFASEYFDKRHPEKIYLNPLNPNQFVSFGWLVAHYYSTLSLNYLLKIADVDDDHIDMKNYPENCSKFQIARQNFNSGIIDFLFVSKISFLERGLILLHETLMKIKNSPGSDATPIRRAVEEFVNDPDFLTDLLNQYLVWNKSQRKLPPLSRQQSEDIQFSNAYCQSQDIKVHENECKVVRDRMAKYDEAMNKIGTLKTLLQLPRELNCKGSWSEVSSKIAIDWAPQTFSLVRRRGTGEPGIDSQYDFKFNGSPRSAQLNFGNITMMGRTQRYEHGLFIDSPYGELYWGSDLMNLPASLSRQNRAFQFFLMIDSYVDLTKEFIGSIQVNNGEPMNGKNYAYSSFGFVCSSPEESHFGIDPKSKL